MTPLEDEAKPPLNSSLHLGSMTRGPLHDLTNSRSHRPCGQRPKTLNTFSHKGIARPKREGHNPDVHDQGHFATPEKGGYPTIMSTSAGGVTVR